MGFQFSASAAFRTTGGLYTPDAHIPPVQRAISLFFGDGLVDTRTGIPARGLAGAICVQDFDDSLNSGGGATYRISLRSSSLREPRYPLLKVVSRFFSLFFLFYTTRARKRKGRNQSSLLSPLCPRSLTKFFF
jgi:hypothetical protein